jgi:glycosyltransferase involved in cell wall biosynthesis
MLVCPEPLAHGQPAGIGIRFLEMAGVLRADGHEVTILAPDGGEMAIDGYRMAAITPETLRDVSAASDMAVVQGHVANDLFAHAVPLPVVVDLYDPFIVENLHYYAERGAEVYTHDHTTLIDSLVRGDLFLCASEAQRLFWLGMLLAVGRLNPIAFESDPHLDDLLRIAPFGVQPSRPPVKRSLDRPALLFGGIYDWYDPLLAIDAVALARREIPQLTLTFTRHPNPELTPQGKTAQAMAYVKKRSYGDFVSFEPWVAYGERGPFFERFALSLLTFPQSIETDLSMRTRIYDYLWGGLPIVTSSAPGTDELILRYRAGAIVRSERAADFAAELVAALRDPERYQVLSAATRVFAEEHRWPRTLQPLRDFVRAPRIDETKHAFATRPRVPERPRSILHRLKQRIGGPF